MRSGERFPDDQAEIVFSDAFVEYLEALPEVDRESVLEDVLVLCWRPWGKHPLSNYHRGDMLAGWNTMDVLGGKHRVVFESRIDAGVGTIEVLCAGPRRAAAAYDLANALIRTGRLTDEEVTQIWTALALLEVVAETVGLDGWDFVPPPAPSGMVKTAVAAGVLDEQGAAVLSVAELQAAMAEGWGPDGPDPFAALIAALRQARLGVEPGDVMSVLRRRYEPRCGEHMPRARCKCIRRVDHPGPHRSSH